MVVNSRYNMQFLYTSKPAEIEESSKGYALDARWL